MKARAWSNCFAKPPGAGSCPVIQAGCCPHLTRRTDERTSADEFAAPQDPASQPLIEPLTEREREVLRLFKTELSGPEIARELVIGLSTVRTHTKSIYSKLNVNNRRAAVKRAEELGLI